MANNPSTPTQISLWRTIRTLLISAREVGGVSALLDLRYLNNEVIDFVTRSRRNKDDAHAPGLEEELASRVSSTKLGAPFGGAVSVTCSDGTPCPITSLRKMREGAHWIRFSRAGYATTQEQLLRCTGVAAEDVLHAQYTPVGLVPAHFLLVDHAHRAVVLTIRGTATLRDVLSDSAAVSVALQVATLLLAIPVVRRRAMRVVVH